MKSLGIHNCEDIRFQRHMPANGNSISLTICTDVDEFELTLFNLPAGVVEKVYEAFGPPMHIVSGEQEEADIPELFGEVSQ